MKLIKLSAIDSTNTYLKELTRVEDLENFTVVSTKTQTKGKGQRGSTWLTEPNKNLIISILIKNYIKNSNQIFDLNVIVALSVITVLEREKIPNLAIKWPNDIMSENKKIGGILIENSLKGSQVVNSIVGLGLNVNQTYFENLPKASSLKNATQKDFDIDFLLIKIVEEVKKNVLNVLNSNTLKNSWNEYNKLLFKKGIPTAFQDSDQSKFMGIILTVNPNGTLNLLLENDNVKSFEIKEIEMLY